MTELHALQKETVSLLKELSGTDRLALTRAMLTIENGYYPSLEDILKTLKHYQDIERVRVFLKTHEDLVEKTKAELAESQSQEKMQSTNSADDFSDIFAIPEKRPPLFEQIKSVSIKELEQAMSAAISNTIDCEVAINVEAIANKTDSFAGSVKLDITIEQK